MNLMPNFLRTGDRVNGSATEGEPPQSQFPGFPEPPLDARRKRWTERVMEAGQHVEDLEKQVDRLNEELNLERNSNSLLTETNKILHEQIDALEKENRALRDS